MTDNRNQEIDNLKGIAIFLVVLGHVIENNRAFYNDPVLSMSFSFIYAFHMPLFAAISGYLTHLDKTENYAKKQVEKCLVPFIVFHVLYWLLGSRDISSILSPAWGTWYFLSLFFWRMIVKPSLELRFSLCWAVALSIAVGFTKADTVLSLSRTIALYPFFLGGYMYRMNKLDTVRSIEKRKGLAILGICFTGAMATLYRLLDLPIDLLYMKSSYINAGCSNFTGAVFRTLYLFTATIMVMSCCTLVTRKACILGVLGKHSSSIYLFHLPARRLLFFIGFYEITKHLSGIGFLLVAIVVTCGLCVTFGNQYVNFTMSWMIRLGNKLLITSMRE